MTLSEELVWRGMVHQSTLSDLKTLDHKKITFYHGFDASAPSQTVGNLAAMMVDLAFLRHGHKAIVLAGGSTSLIGDPSGKDKERVMQSTKTIAQNVKNAKKQIEKIYRGYSFRLVNNLDWTKKLTLLEFLRDVGKHFNVGEMVKRDYIKDRIGGSGISYTEFSYSLLQGFDYLHLYKKHGTTLQIGGSDQWGNCVSGIDLVRRVTGAEVHCMTLPLIINKATGKKFGKSEAGAIWLDPKLTSVYDFYQFWINVDDESVKDYLKIFTDIDKDSYEKILTEFEKDHSTRLAQKELAYRVTTLVHGEKEARRAEMTTESLFNKSAHSHVGAPQISLLSSDVSGGSIDLVSFLVSKNIVLSKREARTLIDGGAVSVDDILIKEYSVNASLLKEGTLLRIGKKKHFVIKKGK